MRHTRRNKNEKTQMDQYRGTAASTLACQFGFWSALLFTLTGIGYIAVVGGFIAMHGLILPPVGPIQTFGGVITILDAQLLLVLMASIHETTPARTRILSGLALIFTALFDAMVGINRFVQLSVVHQRLAAGETEGISWFLAYGSHSAMLALEILGWGLFLGIACLLAAPLFSCGKLGQAIRWLFALYGILGLLAAVGFATASPIAAVGFFGWGLVLPVTTALLAVSFGRGGRRSNQQA
jgi:hypothetical protein